MRVAMIASECEPYAKTGGLADVVDALSRALAQAGHEVDVYLPRYRGLDAPQPAKRLSLEVPTGAGRSESVTLWTTQGRGYTLRLVDHPPSYDRPDYYVTGPGAGIDYPDNGFRFSLLARTALEAMRAESRPVDVIHGHDWEGAPAILLRRFVYAADPIVARAATVMTCHNLAYHGWVTRSEVAAQLDLPATVGAADGVDLLREGILAADMVNTVSPGFAAESLTPEFGAGVDDALRSLAGRYAGIINGIDTELWNPATDAEIPARYSAVDMAGKDVCRGAAVRRARARSGRCVVRDGQQARSAEGLRPCRNRCRDAARGRRAHLRPGHGRSAPDRGPGGTSRIWRGARSTGGSRALRPRPRAAHVRRCRRVSDAVTLRAVRPGPDDLAALRDAAGRARDRRSA